MTSKMYKLASGYHMPCVAVEVTWAGSGDDSIINQIVEAVQAGFVHFDLTHACGKERAVGEAFKCVLDIGLVEREDLFISTTLWNDGIDAGIISRVCHDSVKELHIGYFDLCLIHFPVAWQEKPNGVPLLSSWHAMERLVYNGKCRSIGVSNYPLMILPELMRRTKIPVSCNRIEKQKYFITLVNNIDTKSKGQTPESWTELNPDEDPLARCIWAEWFGNVEAQGIPKEGIVVLPTGINTDDIRKTRAPIQPLITCRASECNKGPNLASSATRSTKKRKLLIQELEDGKGERDITPEVSKKKALVTDLAINDDEENGQEIRKGPRLYGHAEFRDDRMAGEPQGRVVDRTEIKDRRSKRHNFVQEAYGQKNGLKAHYDARTLQQGRSESILKAPLAQKPCLPSGSQYADKLNGNSSFTSSSTETIQFKPSMSATVPYASVPESQAPVVDYNRLTHPQVPAVLYSSLPKQEVYEPPNEKIPGREIGPLIQLPVALQIFKGESKAFHVPSSNNASVNAHAEPGQSIRVAHDDSSTHGRPANEIFVLNGSAQYGEPHMAVEFSEVQGGNSDTTPATQTAQGQEPPVLFHGAGPTLVGPMDVLCGRSKHAQLNPGNVRFRALVESFLPHFAKAETKREKNDLIQKCHDVFMESGGRFLQQESGAWHELRKAQAFRKVGQLLRDKAYLTDSKPVDAEKGQVITEIHPKDIVCSGELLFAKTHPGNYKFRTIASSFLTPYANAATQEGKAVVYKKCIQAIKDSGARFVQKDGDRWVELTERRISRKVQRFLREKYQTIKKGC